MVEVLDLMLAASRGDYAERRQQIAQAVPQLNDLSLRHDRILAAAARGLTQAIQQVGGGDVVRAIDLAYQASPHDNRQHFQHFLPMVGPAGLMVRRQEQLEKGATVLPV